MSLLKVSCSQCGYLIETSSRRQAVNIGNGHQCLGEIEVEEIFDFGPEIKEDEGWSGLTLVGALIFLALVLCSFFLTLELGFK